MSEALREVPIVEYTMRAKFKRDTEASGTDYGEVGIKKGQCLSQQKEKPGL